jgi:hypothetical protein
VNAPPFALLYTAEAERILDELCSKKQHERKRKKVQKTLVKLERIGPSCSGFHSHPYQSVRGPGGAQLWESYVENRTPSAWRMWWIYGPGGDEITIVTIGPHP